MRIYNGKMILVLLIVFLISLFLFGCRETPELSVADDISEKIEDYPMENELMSKEDFLIPDSWEERIDLKNISCNIDANITYPVNISDRCCNVERREFNKLDLQKCINLVIGTPSGVRDDFSTKEELEQQLISVKRGAVEYHDDGTRGYVPYEGQDDAIRRIEEKIRNAPAQITYESFREDVIEVPQRKRYRNNNAEEIVVNATKGYININLYADSLIQMESWVIAGEAKPGEKKGTTLENVVVEKEYAEDCALNALQTLEIKGFGISECEKARIVDLYTTETLTEGWYVKCDYNNYGGVIPFRYDNVNSSSVLDLETAAYTVPWRMETVSFFINENGIAHLLWENPLMYTDKNDEHSQLLPFSEIKEAIRRMINYGLSWTEEISDFNKGIEGDVILYSIKYSVCLLPEKNNIETGILTPTWLCFYNTEFAHSCGMLPNVICINALDGSRVAPIIY